ncbi:MAG: tRNA uridine-5-carboxymethylaminomethyl(34) synthesis GTPase MnmE [Proteobacteria bacterium]|nr:tRNA uridine-5-carboxymethylaminomethyl(34) synthesis GTPase MnmE [Pseudomonadota bacterium]
MRVDSATSTIAALATAPAPAGIAVVRVSGPKARNALTAIFKGTKDPLADPRRLIYGQLIDYSSGDSIDLAMAVFMPGPHSFTGEDICEFQFHGSPVIVQKVLRSLFAFGALPAEAGEFTKRAFLNGKVDLAQAEAICDLINATGEQAAQVASEQLRGRLSSMVSEIGEPLRDALAELEASIDFPEEGIEPARLSEIAAALALTRSRLEGLLELYRYGQVMREGFKVLLCGRPNVGKSSILNLLVGRERAIVSPISGTTRDLIEEEAIFAGYRFVFCDCAGFTQTADTVEQIGIARARERVGWADLVLCIADATDPSDSWKEIVQELRPEAKQIWMVTNKIDLNPNAFGHFLCDSKVCSQNFYLSAKTRAGFDPLVQALVEEIKASRGNSAESSGIVINERHRRCLDAAQQSVRSAEGAIQAALPLEIVSAEVRLALTALEEIVGKTYTEDILGRIFSKFCVGK